MDKYVSMATGAYVTTEELLETAFPIGLVSASLCLLFQCLY